MEEGVGTAGGVSTAGEDGMLVARRGEGGSEASGEDTAGTALPREAAARGVVFLAVQAVLAGGGESRKTCEGRMS